MTKRDSENFTVGQKVIAVKDIGVEADLHYASQGEVLIIREIDDKAELYTYGVSHEYVYDCFWVAGDEIKFVEATS